MGVNELWDILKEHGCGNRIPLSELRKMIEVDGQCRLAIDAYIIYHQYFCTTWKWVVQSSTFSYDRVVSECVRRIDDMAMNIRTYGIDLLWCVDGDRSEDKLATGRRADKRDAKLMEIAKMHQLCTLYCENHEPETPEALEVGRYDFLREFWPRSSRVEAGDAARSAPEYTTPASDFNLAEKLNALRVLLSKYPVMTEAVRRTLRSELESRGHSFLAVPGISEGEKLCAITLQIGLCQAVLGSDGDLIPMGTRCVIKGIEDNVATVYSYNEVLHKLGINHEKLMSLCIILGNDFNDGIAGMGKVKCLHEVTVDPEFNLHDFDIRHGGILRVGVCRDAFTISLREQELVEREVMKQLSRNVRPHQTDCDTSS